MAQSLSNQNTNAQSMNGLITIDANTITTGSIQTDTINITNSGTIDGTLTVSGAITCDNVVGQNITGTNNIFNTTTTGAVKLATNLSGVGSVVVGNVATHLNNTFYGRTTLPPSTTNIIGGDTAISLFNYILYATNNNFSGEFTPKANV